GGLLERRGRERRRRLLRDRLRLDRADGVLRLARERRQPLGLVLRAEHLPDPFLVRAADALPERLVQRRLEALAVGGFERGFQAEVVLRHEVGQRLLALDDEAEGGGLDAPGGEAGGGLAAVGPR